MGDVSHITSVSGGSVLAAHLALNWDRYCGSEEEFDAAAKDYDAVVGSRFSPQSILINYPLGKILANRGFHLLFNLIFRRRHRDLTNNLKLMRTDVARRLVLEMPTFAVNAEIGLQLVLMGCRVEEVPISWVDRSFDMGTSSFRIFQVGGGYFRVLARFARETRFGFRTLQRESPVQQARAAREFEQGAEPTACVSSGRSAKL